MRKVLFALFSAALIAGLPGIALASAGTARGVDPSAEAVGVNDTRTLVVGSDINIGDLIKTGPKGQVEILFSDDTKLVVGPNSNLKIEAYLLRSDNTASKVAVDMLAGSFRFMTGNSPKSAYQIDTPTGTIGVRGTRYDVHVDDHGFAWIMGYEGILKFCVDHSNVCQELSKLCQIGQISTQDATILGNANDLVGEERNTIKSYFIYAMDESPLDREFRIPHAYECLHKLPDISVPATLGSTPGSGDPCGRGDLNFDSLLDPQPARPGSGCPG